MPPKRRAKPAAAQRAAQIIKNTINSAAAQPAAKSPVQQSGTKRGRNSIKGNKENEKRQKGSLTIPEAGRRATFKFDKTYILNEILDRIYLLKDGEKAKMYAWAYVFKLFDSMESTTLNTALDRPMNENLITKLINDIHEQVKQTNRWREGSSTTGESKKINKMLKAAFVFNLYLEGYHDDYIDRTNTLFNMLKTSQNFLKETFRGSRQENGKTITYSFALDDVEEYLTNNKQRYKDLNTDITTELSGIKFPRFGPTEAKKAAIWRANEKLKIAFKFMGELHADDIIGRCICLVPTMYDQIYEQNGTNHLPTGWEGILKNNLPSIFNIPSTLHHVLPYDRIKPGNFLFETPIGKKKPDHLYIRSEQEKQERHTGSMVTATADVKRRNYESKIFTRESQIYLPLIAMYDAGSKMILRGVITEHMNIVEFISNIQSPSYKYQMKVVPYSAPFKYSFIDETGRTFFYIESTIKKPPSSGERGGPTASLIYKLQINNIENIVLTSTAAQAGKGKDIKTQLGKWSGDNAPNIEEIHINTQLKKNQTPTNNLNPRIMSSGDGNNVIGYVSFSEKFMAEGAPTCLMVDPGIQSKSLLVFGFELNPSTPKPEVSVATMGSLKESNNETEINNNLLLKFVETNKQNIRNLYTQQFNGNQEASTGGNKKMSKIQFIQLLKRILEDPEINNGSLIFAAFKNYFNNEINRLNKNRKGKAPMPAWSEQGGPMNANGVGVMNESGGPNVAGPSRPPGLKEQEKQLKEQEKQLKAQRKQLKAQRIQKKQESKGEDMFVQILTRLNTRGLLSKLSVGNKNKIIEHLKEYYKNGNDNEPSRIKFIQEILEIIETNPVKTIISYGPPMSSRIANNPNIQKYLENNSIKKGKMNANN